MNSIGSNIQFTYETENNNFLPFLYTPMIRTENGFPITDYRKSFVVSLPQLARSCHSCVLCSDSHSLNSMSQSRCYFVRGYNPSIIDTALFKLQHSRSSNLCKSISLNNCIVLPFFPKYSFYIAKTLRQFDFRIIFKFVN